MPILGDAGTFQLMIGLVLLLILYWVAKFVISLWTGS